MATVLRRFSGELRRVTYSSLLPPRHRLLSTSTARLQHQPSPFAISRPIGDRGFAPSPFSHSQMFVRWRTKETRVRAPATPVKSKLNKYKIKAYSSYKSRFKLLKDGTIRRWKEGNRHNAHSKSKKAKRRLRRPAIVPLALAKVMKKLHFLG